MLQSHRQQLQLDMGSSALSIAVIYTSEQGGGATAMHTHCGGATTTMGTVTVTRSHSQFNMDSLPHHR